jgi:hypothetical protein
MHIICICYVICICNMYILYGDIICILYLPSRYSVLIAYQPRRLKKILSDVYIWVIDGFFESLADSIWWYVILFFIIHMISCVNHMARTLPNKILVVRKHLITDRSATLKSVKDYIIITAGWTRKESENLPRK